MAIREGTKVYLVTVEATAQVRSETHDGKNARCSTVGKIILAEVVSTHRTGAEQLGEIHRHSIIRRNDWRYGTDWDYMRALSNYWAKVGQGV
jgi:hypothetical protein